MRKTFIGILILALVIGGYYFIKSNHSASSSLVLEDEDIPLYELSEIALDTKITSAAVIDVNADGVEDVFFATASGAEDQLFTCLNNRMVPLQNFKIPEKGNVTTHGMVVIDSNSDDRPDMYVLREDGVFLYLNTDQGFEASKLPISFDSLSYPSSLSIADLNYDGLEDLFVGVQTRRPQVNAQEDTLNNKVEAGLLLINKGGLLFENKTASAGISYSEDLLKSVFVDLNADQALDLISVYADGHAIIYKSNGNLTFTMVKDIAYEGDAENVTLSVEDYNSDGRPDFSLNTEIYKNIGKFRFRSLKEEKSGKLSGQFSGAIFQDMNIDGAVDIIALDYLVESDSGAQPLTHPFSFLLQVGKETFAASSVIDTNAEVRGLVNADFNQDGYPDLINFYEDRRPMLLLSKRRNSNYLKVKLKDRVRSVGARVTVKSEASKQTKFFVIGDGKEAEDSHTLIFGLGKENHVHKVEVLYHDGTEDEFTNPFVNRTLLVRKREVDKL